MKKALRLFLCVITALLLGAHQHWQVAGVDEVNQCCVYLFPGVMDLGQQLVKHVALNQLAADWVVVLRDKSPNWVVSCPHHWG